MPEVVADCLRPGGVLCACRDHDTAVSHGRNPASNRRLDRTQGLRDDPARMACRGLAVRPDHRMVGHTAFVYSRRLAPGYPHPPNAAVLRRALTVRDYTARAHPPPLGRSNRRALEIL